MERERARDKWKERKRERVGGKERALVRKRIP